MNSHSPFTWNIEQSFPNIPPAFKQLSDFNKHTNRNKILTDHHTK